MSSVLARAVVRLAPVVLGLLAWCAAPAALAEDTQRLIVKLAAPAAGAKAAMPPGMRLARLADDLGVGLTRVRTLATGADVVALDRPVDLASAQAIAARIAARPGVAYAEPDRRMRALRTVNDEFAASQGYLGNGPASIGASAAWDVTTGSPGVVVAVVDTGVRPHADLAGRVLPGYDMIADPGTSNDGDGRDADASDPGDYVTSAEASGDCPAQSSSWHGTAVAGIIAANSNNGQWVAGIDWNAKILPVRVLGHCGGYTSDIADGIAWAAGVAVPGVPPNPNPAQVINLSLGAQGACSLTYIDAIATAYGQGSARAIVVAAGNSEDDSQRYEPANCPGVISVASTTSTGSITRYSNFGPGITLSAPGGQYSAHSGTEGIVVLSNAGATTPGADSIGVEGGTSFAAPMVSGTIALMLAVAPTLTVTQVHDVLTASAKPFPAGSTCSTLNCGAGIVDAGAAVRAAAAAAPATAATVSVVEYYNSVLDHYFITWHADEQQNLDAGNTPTRWTRTGLSFKAWSAAQPGTSPVCRYYIPPGLGDSHFFGRGTAECSATGQKNPTFVLEDDAFMQMMLPQDGTCPAATVPVYRVFSNRADANHRYMTDIALREQMVGKGWLAEGDGPQMVVMCGPQ